MSLRALQRRVKRMEEGRKPKPSPIVVIFGSFDGFVDVVFAEIMSGKLSDEWYDLLACLRRWEEGGTWERAYAR